MKMTFSNVSELIVMWFLLSLHDVKNVKKSKTVLNICIQINIFLHDSSKAESTYYCYVYIM